MAQAGASPQEFQKLIAAIRESEKALDLKQLESAKYWNFEDKEVRILTETIVSRVAYIVLEKSKDSFVSEEDRQELLSLLELYDRHFEPHNVDMRPWTAILDGMRDKINVEDIRLVEKSSKGERNGIWDRPIDRLLVEEVFPLMESIMLKIAGEIQATSEFVPGPEDQNAEGSLDFKELEDDQVVTILMEGHEDLTGESIIGLHNRVSENIVKAMLHRLDVESAKQPGDVAVIWACLRVLNRYIQIDKFPFKDAIVAEAGGVVESVFEFVRKNNTFKAVLTSVSPELQSFIINIEKLTEKN